MGKSIGRFVLLTVAILAVACGRNRLPGTDDRVIKLMTHDSFDIGAEVLSSFEEQSGYRVEVFKAGDGGEALNKAILAKDAPLADVFYGVDNTFLSRALENELFLPYDSPKLDDISDALELDPQSRALPVDYGDICLNYDVNWFRDRGVAPPDDLADLVSPEYNSLTVVENPATSTPGLGFLLVTIDAFGEDGYLKYWQQLVDNGALVVDGWEQAYYSHFTAASDGDKPIVVSYASSPVAEVYFAEQPLDEAPTAAVVSDGTCFRQIEFVGILRGTEVEDGARQLIDFMLDEQFQEDIPLKMFVYPANESAQLPEVFAEHSTIPDVPSQIDPARIAANREAWIEAWTGIALR
ncbi:MAG TPA: thiamine ABC transporter substrate-binding protein [Promineifilum sp.]